MEHYRNPKNVGEIENPTVVGEAGSLVCGDMLKLYLKINDKNVFSGDSLIPGQKTITRLPGGSKKLFIEKTLPYIEKLDIDSVIYPGHYNVVMLRNLKITENRNE